MALSFVEYVQTDGKDLIYEGIATLLRSFLFRHSRLQTEKT